MGLGKSGARARFHDAIVGQPPDRAEVGSEIWPPAALHGMLCLPDVGFDEVERCLSVSDTKGVSVGVISCT